VDIACKCLNKDTELCENSAPWNILNIIW
jgi:hypothetical protein